jgi:hypothetical protein
MRFHAYGLIWESEHPIPFPPFEAGRTDADVRITFDADLGKRAHGDRPVRNFTREGDDWRLEFVSREDHWGDYHYTAATRTLAVSASLSVDLCWAPLVGLAPAILLRDRGETVLHGSALAVGAGAFVIVGDAGRGKSTLSLGMARRGAAVASDDLVAFELGLTPAVRRGYTRIAVLNDALEALGVAPEDCTDVRAGDGKVQVRSQGLAEPLTPLAGVVVLEGFDDGLSQPILTRLTPAASAYALTRHIYGGWIRPPERDDFAVCMHLAAAAPVFRLDRPRDLARLSQGCALIEAAAGRA